MTSHTRKWKEQQVQELLQLSNTYPVIAIASLQNFPASLSQLLRKRLQGKAVIKISKTRVVKKALLESKIKSDSLLKHTEGSIAVIFSNVNPFELFASLKKNKVSMPAKVGMVAPNDIIVPAGDTGLPPGPALSDLKQAGLKTILKGPTISIAEDSIVAKKGQPISKEAAAALTKLDIKPIKVGLNIVACLEDGQIFTAEVLDIDTEEVFEQFKEAHRNAFNLAIEIAYTNERTIELLLSKAFKNAKAVSVEANILNSATVEAILGKAFRQASALGDMVKEVPVGEKREERKEEEKIEGEKPAGKSGEGEEGNAGEGKKKEGKEETPVEEKKEGKEETPVEKKSEAEDPAEGKPAREPSESSAEEQKKEEPKKEKSDA